MLHKAHRSLPPGAAGSTQSACMPHVGMFTAEPLEGNMPFGYVRVLSPLRVRLTLLRPFLLAAFRCVGALLACDLVGVACSLSWCSLDVVFLNF